MKPDEETLTRTAHDPKGDIPAEAVGIGCRGKGEKPYAQEKDATQEKNSTEENG